MSKSLKTRSKFPALITYFVALLALAAGLVVPLYSTSLASVDWNNMPVMEVFSAVAIVFGLQAPLFGLGNGLYYWDMSVNLFGFEFNFFAILLIAYTAVAAVGVILFLVACITKRRNTVNKIITLKFASVIEVLALVILTIPVINNLTYGASNQVYGYNLSLIIAYGGTLAMLIVQAIVYRGMSGVFKTILFALSAFAILFTMMPVTVMIPGIEGTLQPVNDLLGTGWGLYGIEGNMVTGESYINVLLTDPIQIFQGSWLQILLTVFISLLVIMVFVNYFCDLAGLGKRTNKFLLISNMIRDLITFIALVGATVMVFVLKYTYGIMFILLALIVVIQTLINIIRIVGYRSPKKKTVIVVHDDEEEEQRVVYQPEPEPEPVRVVERVVTQPAPVQETVVAEEPEIVVDENTNVYTTYTTQENGTVVETRNVVYKVNTIYDGPSDDFIKKLSNDEKVEFARNFLGERDGTLNNVPNYVVGGNNTKFFTSLFIYLAKIRDMVSDGLMKKFYEEVNLLR